MNGTAVLISVLNKQHQSQNNGHQAFCAQFKLFDKWLPDL